jgi:hypothetical protein
VVTRLRLALLALLALALAMPFATAVAQTPAETAAAETTAAQRATTGPVALKPAVAIDGARLRLEIVSNGRTPFVQEMVLVTVRGFYTIPITLTKLEVPPMEGFRVLTIGREHWSEAEEDGVQGRGLEQTLALFPQASGTLTIPPIVQRLTVVGADGKRVEVSIATAATPLEVAPPPADAGAWWLPARRLTLTETWSEPPEALTIGRPVRRIVTLEAEGVTDDQLPPPPVLKADRLIVFSEAPERRTVIAATPKGKKGEALRQSMPRPGRLATVEGRDGPIGRIVYSWAVRPVSGAPAELPEIVIPWFDTEAGVMRTAVLPARTVAFRQTGRSLADLERDIGLAAAPAEPARRSPGDVALAALAFLAAATATTALLGRRLVPAGGPLARFLGTLRNGITRRRAARALRRGDEAAAWRLYASLGAEGEAERAAVERPLFGGGRDRP